jgi:hypothetical protein
MNQRTLGSEVFFGKKKRKKERESKNHCGNHRTALISKEDVKTLSLLQTFEWIFIKKMEGIL